MQEEVRQLKANQSHASLQGISRIWSQPSLHGPIKPPQLDLAPFSGEVLIWQEFWDAFEAAVDKLM